MPQKAPSAAARIGAKVRAAGGKMQSLQAQLGELQKDVEYLERAGERASGRAAAAARAASVSSGPFHHHPPFEA